MKKKIIKYLSVIAFVICLFTPQSTNSYEFSSKQRESQVRETRREIYTLYDMRKEMIREGSEESNEYGVIGYNGVCSTVTVDGKSIPLDQYIAGVIKQEMGGNNLEALKAQAIAARSFLLGTHKNSSSCSVTNGQSYQAYTDANSDDIYMKAATETSNMVVSRNGEVATTQYQSHPAGKWCTEDSSGWHVKFQRFSDDASSAWTWNGPSKEKVRKTAGDGSLYGTEMDYNNPHHFGMSQTIAMYLAKGENYTYDKILQLFYAQPIVTLTDGVYDGDVTYVKGNSFGKVVYYNQGDYKGYYLSTDPKKKWSSGTIPNAGCGPTAIAMVVSSMLNKKIDPVATTKVVCKYGRCSSGGTYIDDLYTAMTKDYGLKVKWEGNKQKVINALSSGNSLVIALMGPGTFTSNGHYIVLTGINEQGKVSVADPASRERTKKLYPFNLILEQKQRSNFLVITK